MKPEAGKREAPKVVALVGRPDPRALSQVPVIVESGGQLLLRGAGRDRVLNEIDPDARIDRVEIHISPDEVPNLCALWVGSEFRGETQSLGVGLGGLAYCKLGPPRAEVRKASVYLGTTAQVYDLMDHFVDVLTKSVCGDYFSYPSFSYNRRIATLARWALPDDIRSMRAMWRTDDDPSARVELYARRLEISESEMLRRLADETPFHKEEKK